MVEKSHSTPIVEQKVLFENIENILPTPVASPMQQPQTDDEIETPAQPALRASKRRAAAPRSNDTYYDETPVKKPRGRPPKTEPTRISQAEFRRMSLQDRRYLEMRLKNNEASRRSRLSRKDKEQSIFTELEQQEQINRRLREQDQQLDIEIQTWRKRLMKLAKL